MPITIQQAGGFPSTGNIIRFSSYFWEDSQYAIINNDFYVSTMTGTPLTLGDLAQYFQQQIDAPAQAIVSTDVKILGTKCSVIVSATGKPLPGIAASTTVGSMAPPSAPKQTALVWTKQTLVTGRDGRGRNYLPWPGVGAVVAGGEPDPVAYMPNAQAMVNNIFGISTITIGLGTVGLIYVITHRKTGGFQAVVGQRLNAKFGTQRRRGAYGRTNPDTIQ